MPLVRAAKKIIRRLAPLEFSEPVHCVYNPLEYAWKPHSEYLRRYGSGKKDYLMLGMNPGPFGMAQTGVPFGEIAAVRDFLGISGKVSKPTPEHPKREIQGFDCTRSEVSGRRLWGWCEERFKEPERFFERFFVHNFCPLVFMAESGANITPDKLLAAERDPLFAACDDALREVVTALQPKMLIGVGVFAEKRAKIALADFDIEFGRIPHPSPASPLANRGWAEAAEAALEDLGVA